MSADPVTAAVVFAATAAAQKSAARAQARQYENSAAELREQAALEAADLQRQNRRDLGRQRTLFAKSGVRLEGTPLLVQGDTVAAGAAEASALQRRTDSRVASLLGRAGTARGAAAIFPLFR